MRPFLSVHLWQHVPVVLQDGISSHFSQWEGPEGPAVPEDVGPGHRGGSGQERRAAAGKAGMPGLCAVWRWGREHHPTSGLLIFLRVYLLK